jgi:hypothetical protein
VHACRDIFAGGRAELGTVASTDAGTEYIASTLALSNPSHSWGISGSVGRP